MRLQKFGGECKVHAYYSKNEICVMDTVRCPSRMLKKRSILWPLNARVRRRNCYRSHTLWTDMLRSHDPLS